MNLSVPYIDVSYLPLGPWEHWSFCPATNLLVSPLLPPLFADYCTGPDDPRAKCKE